MKKHPSKIPHKFLFDIDLEEDCDIQFSAYNSRVETIDEIQDAERIAMILETTSYVLDSNEGETTIPAHIEILKTKDGKFLLEFSTKDTIKNNTAIEVYDFNAWMK